MEIAFHSENPVPTATEIPAGSTLVYAQSNLCFIDTYGRPILRPEATALGFPQGSTIDWEKSQVRSRVYQTWNRKRHNRDADRMIILKGSVLVVAHQEPVSEAIFAQGVGAFRSEGFGKVLLNPNFLKAEDYVLRLGLSKLEAKDWLAQEEGYAQTKSAQDEIILTFLARRKERNQKAFNLDKKINEFLASEEGKAFNGLNSSQWGTVRAYAKHSANWDTLDKLLFDESIGAFYRGQSEKEWRKNARRDKLKIFLARIPEQDRISATLKLAAEMAKRSRNKETSQTTTT
jgi:hypothetical protein